MFTGSCGIDIEYFPISLGYAECFKKKCQNWRGCSYLAFESHLLIHSPLKFSMKTKVDRTCFC